MIQDKYASLIMVSPETISSTVMCDERTCLWFRKLFSLPNVVRRIQCYSEAWRCYRYYSLFTLAAATLVLVALVLCLAGIFLLPGRFVVFSIAGAAAAAAAVGCMIRARYDLAGAAGCLVGLDSSEIPAGITLYQLGEIYSRKYGVISLVKVIWIWDQRLRDVFLFLFFIPFGVLFLSVWHLFAWLALGIFLAACWVKIFVLSRWV